MGGIAFSVLEPHDKATGENIVVQDHQREGR